jgi:hypothetical protein
MDFVDLLQLYVAAITEITLTLSPHFYTAFTVHFLTYIKNKYQQMHYIYEETLLYHYIISPNMFWC